MTSALLTISNPVGAFAGPISKGVTNPVIEQPQAASGVGGTLTVGGQPGAAGSLSGNTLIDLGPLVSNASAKLQLVVGAVGSKSSVLDASQTAASTVTIAQPAGYSFTIGSASASASLSLAANTTIVAEGGGNVTLSSFSGTLVLQSASRTTRLTCDATGLGFYGHAGVAQPSRVGQLTDSTTGTPGTTLAAIGGTTYTTDVPTIRNWIASLAAKVNGIETAIHNIGLTA